MSLPDSAEYWWDVKGYNRKEKHVFTHIKGIACGHYHVYESNDVKEIDCRSCKKVLAEIPEIKDSISKLNEKENAPFGRCTCGNPFVKRTNRTDNKQFLGCSNYPKCKNTKTLNPS